MSDAGLGTVVFAVGAVALVVFIFVREMMDAHREYRLEVARLNAGHEQRMAEIRASVPRHGLKVINGGKS